MFVVAAIVIAVPLVFVGLVTTGLLPTALVSSSWTERTVTLSPVSQSCYFVNSSAHADRFCLRLLASPGGLILNGTFDHGPGTNVSAVAMGQGLACAMNPSNCPPGRTWTSPDGSGRIWWTFTSNVTLEALN